MFNQINNISKGNLFSFIKSIGKFKLAPKEVINEFGVIEGDNDFGSILIKPNNQFFKRIVLQMDQSKRITSIRFFGDFDLRISDLNDLFNDVRKFYSSYDDHYEYFFNESHSANYVLKTISSHNIESDLNWDIKNLEIRWG